MGTIIYSSHRASEGQDSSASPVGLTKCFNPRNVVVALEMFWFDCYLCEVSQCLTYQTDVSTLPLLSSPVLEDTPLSTTELVTRLVTRLSSPGDISAKT